MHEVFSMGTNYGFFNIDTTQDAICASRCYKEIPPDNGDPTCEVVPSSGNFEEYFKNRKIIFLAGHGNKNRMRFKCCNGGDEILVYANGMPDTDSARGIYNIADINKDDRRKKIDLIVYSGCCTAEEDNINGNITNRSVRFYNVNTAVGWRTTINSPESTKWNERFNLRIKQIGVRVNEAIMFANSFIYWPFSGVKNVVIEGDRNLVLNPIQVNNSNKNLAIEEDRQINIDNDIHFNSYDDIEKVIKQTNPDFNISQYRVLESKGTSEFDSIIDITRKIGIFDTVSGYTVFIKDGMIDSIYDNRLEISKEEINKISNLKELPYDKVDKKIDSVIEGISKEEKIKVNEKINYYYYDIEKKETYFITLIDYVSIDYEYRNLQPDQTRYDDLIGGEK